MEYKVEELKFLNMKKIPIRVSNPNKRGGFTVFEIEQALTEEEKLNIIDQLRDGIGSYMFNLIKKWESEKDTLKKDPSGSPKTVSKKAWIKNNDPREKIDITYTIGNYWLFGEEFKGMSLICPTTKTGSYNMAYTGQSVVHEWFHLLCEQLYKEEQKYFKENDPKQIKLKKVKDYARQYGNFENEEINNIAWREHTEVSDERIDEFIAAYEELERAIEKISKKLNK